MGLVGFCLSLFRRGGVRCRDPSWSLRHLSVVADSRVKNGWEPLIWIRRDGWKSLSLGEAATSPGQQKYHVFLEPAFKPSAKAVGLLRSRQFPGIPGTSCSPEVSSGSDAYYSSPFVPSPFSSFLSLPCFSLRTALLWATALLRLRDQRGLSRAGESRGEGERVQKGGGYESPRNLKRKLEPVPVICMKLLFSVTLEKDLFLLLPASHCENSGEGIPLIPPKPLLFICRIAMRCCS